MTKTGITTPIATFAPVERPEFLDWCDAGTVGLLAPVGFDGDALFVDAPFVEEAVVVAKSELLYRNCIWFAQMAATELE
jgi:hypothetical protein